MKKVVGVEAVWVSLRDETVTARRDPALVSNAALAAAVEAAGYEPNFDVVVVLPAVEPRSRLARMLNR